MKDRALEFVAEAEEIMNEASATLLEVQETLPSPRPELINAAFRTMHTLKGMSGLFGYQGLSDISHSLENILDMVRLGKVDLDINVIDFIFGCFDVIKQALNEVREGKELDPSVISKTISDIDSFFSESDSAAASGDELVFPEQFAGLLSVLSEYEEHRLKANVKDGNEIFIINAVFSLEVFDVLLKELTDKMNALGEVVSTMPVSDGVEPGNIGFQVIFASHGADLGKICEVSGYETFVAVGRKQAKSSTADAAAPICKPAKAGKPEKKEPSQEQSLKSTSTSIRVDIGRVDSILDTISGLSMSRHAVFDVWKTFSDEHGNTPLAIDLYRIAQSMQRRLELLQSQVLDIRMVPISSIFTRLSQVVRRYATGAGKSIKLEMFGDETEIDKYVAEEIVDPLMHTVRNAIDHGIESPDDRAASGKPEQGRVELRAFQRGNSVIITIKDDGRGIDAERVRAKAIDNGLISESEKLDDEAVYELMFLPGFSTSEVVTETSGRGVGLDVVREKLDTIGGAVEIQSEPGQGTSFSFTLPITLSLVRALMIRLRGVLYAVPLTSMSETFSVWRKDVQELEEGTMVHNLRGEMLPLAYAADVMHLEHKEMDKFFVVVAGFGHKRVGLIFDEFLGQQEIVIKPLGNYFDGIKGYSGACEMGRNQVVLVLDTETLANEAVSHKFKDSTSAVTP